MIVPNGYEKIVKYLVEHDDDINKSLDDWATYLLVVLEEGNENIVKYLINHGADINKYIKVENEGDSPLWIDAQERQ